MITTILTIIPLVLGLTIVILAMIRKMKPAPVVTSNDNKIDNKSFRNTNEGRVRNRRFEEVKRNG